MQGFENYRTKYQFELPWSSNYCISGTILVTKSMPTDAYGFFPSCKL